MVEYPFQFPSLSRERFSRAQVPLLQFPHRDVDVIIK